MTTQTTGRKMGFPSVRAAIFTFTELTNRYRQWHRQLYVEHRSVWNQY